MRPSSFAASAIRQFLVRNQIADLRELKQALGTSVDVTVFRKLRHWITFPATLTAVATTRYQRSLTSMSTVFGPASPYGFLVTALC